MKRSVKVDLSWRAWSLIVGFFILIGFIGLSFAYGGNSPAIHGHSAGEIEGGAGGTTIVSSCMPDYFNGANKNNGVSYQAPTDGWVKYSTTIQYGTSTFSVSSNNISWVDLMSITAGDWPQRDLGSISLIKAGTYYKGIALTQFVFYPCINSGGGSVGSADYVIESWKATDGSSWYRKWKSGWIEQGGETSAIESGTTTFPLPFTSSISSIMLTQKKASGGEKYAAQITGTPTLNSFTWYWGYAYTTGSTLYWEAKGY